MTAQKTKFYALLAPLAHQAREKFGVPARLILAQAAIESHWGALPIGNNYFGIKKAARHNLGQAVLTTEQSPCGALYKARLSFADYKCVSDSVNDYAWLISNGGPYKTSWAQYQKDHNIEALALGIAKIYATSLNYSQLFLTILRQPDIIEAANDPS